MPPYAAPVAPKAAPTAIPPVNPPAYFQWSDAAYQAERSSTARKSYQARALGRRTCSYQSRQWFQNICCISLCPLIMVAISYALGAVITTLITRSNNFQEFLFCSNLNASDPVLHLPITNVSQLPITPPDFYIPGMPSNSQGVKHTNYYDTATGAIFTGGGPAGGQGGQGSRLIGKPTCEIWLGDFFPNQWPIPSPPYNLPLARSFSAQGFQIPVPPVYTNFTVRDTVNRPQPSTGWLGMLMDPTGSVFAQLTQFQTRPWFQTYSTAGATRDTVGRKEPQNYTVNTVLGPSGLLMQTLTNESTIPGRELPPNFGPIGPLDTGILGTYSENRFHMANLSVNVANLSQVAGAITTTGIPMKLNTMPYWPPITEQVDQGVANNYSGQDLPRDQRCGNGNTAVQCSMDDVIGYQINAVVAQLTLLNKTVLLNPTAATLQDQLNFLAQASAITNQMPYGAVQFKEVDPVRGLLDMMLQIGTDRRIQNAANFPTQWYRNLMAWNGIANTFLRSIAPTLSNATISRGFRAMPQYANTKINLPVATAIGRILYPWGVSFLLPIFVIIMVKEKEDRILSMMKMNGMTSFTYYLTLYIHFLILGIISSAIFLIAGYAFGMELFRRTSWIVLIIVFFVWANIQVVLAFFLSAFFTRSRTALVITFLIVLASVVVSVALDQLFPGDITPALFIWPPFAFYRCLSQMNANSYLRSRRPYTISMLAPPDQVGVALIFMVFEIPIYLLLAAYFNAVFPTEFGVQKPWHFPITDPIKWCMGRSKKRSADPEAGMAAQGTVANNGERSHPIELYDGLPMLAHDLSEAEKENPGNPEEDADVKNERTRVLTNQYDSSRTPLQVVGMRKVYPGRSGKGPKLAVKDITFAVEEGVIFGLLGPNGAGKTTLISILTGLYPPTDGMAKIAGYDIATDMDQVYCNIGICPQHDILWDDLTIEEHLLFYARLKGVPAAEEKEVVKQSMEAVSLQDMSWRLSKGLSGGEKRRLSIAIALVGKPAVVFLDEPTTGLDPEVRRLIWSIINEARTGKTIILTTHSMEEAEVLCQRIGITAKGALRCLGSTLHLKKLYGAGFKLQFACSEARMPQICNFIESLLPPGWNKVDSFSTTASYEFVPQPGLIAKLFERVEARKEELGIDDWGISQTSLEEVFVALISEDDAGAD
ncbi:hypothetical protein DFJ74DRAFT_696885 [Hyaloraphidium curvatum]|nr:hypothetical protein DFJ74DRAFT_696885 [Hyaloraphidium curvatum]